MEKPNLETNINSSFMELKAKQLVKERDRLLGFFFDVSSMVKEHGGMISHIPREEFDHKTAIEALDVYFDKEFIIYPSENLQKSNQNYLEHLYERFSGGKINVEDLLSLLDALEFVIQERNEDIKKINSGNTVDKNSYFNKR